MSVKKIVGKIHLWLGLASGLIVFVVGLTGSILAFEEEICSALNYGVFQQVKKEDKQFATPSTVFSVADEILADKKIARTYYTMYPNKNRVSALWALDSTRQYHAVLQNPYSGEVVTSYDYKNAFFAWILRIHLSLGIGEAGSMMVKYATLIFVVLMITGIILWKPASRKGYKQRFTIKWNAKAKRLNYDLHNVLGFYMSWIAIFIALTGLIWSFEWMNDSAQWIANGGKSITAKRDKTSSDTNSVYFKTPNHFYTLADSLIAYHLRESSSIEAVRIYKPSSPADALRITIESEKGASYGRSDDYLYDQYSGKALAVKKFSDLTNGEKLRRMNYYIHVGSIGGITGKFLAFFASIIAASLPVTGLVIWLGRKKKKKKAVTSQPQQ